MNSSKNNNLPIIDIPHLEKKRTPNAFLLDLKERDNSFNDDAVIIGDIIIYNTIDGICLEK